MHIELTWEVNAVNTFAIVRDHKLVHWGGCRMCVANVSASSSYSQRQRLPSVQSVRFSALMQDESQVHEICVIL